MSSLYETIFWIDHALEFLQEKKMGPGAIVDIKSSKESLFICVADENDLNKNKKFISIFDVADKNIDKMPPAIFIIQEIIIYSEEILLIKLLGGICYQQEYYFAIDMIDTQECSFRQHIIVNRPWTILQESELNMESVKMEIEVQ